MIGRAAPNSGAVDPLLDALSRTGAIGSTVAQLSHRTGARREDILARLEALGGTGEVARIGRGLWILTGYADLEDRDDFVGPDQFLEDLQRENGVIPTQYNGSITFSPNDSLPVHRWWPYVQGFSAEFVHNAILSDNLPPASTVLDPFCGSGTTLVEARRSGHRAIGGEILAPAALAARVKTHFELDPKELLRQCDRVLAAARKARAGKVPFLRETLQQFDPDSLSRLLRLRDSLPSEGPPVANALRVAFDRILIPSSRLRRSPCLGYRPKGARSPIEDPFDGFRDAVARMGEDLEALRTDPSQWGPPSRVHLGDSRTLDLPPGSVDLAITSPPYVNGMDYVMNYKLDLAWLGYARDYADLADLRHRMVACDNLPREEAARYARRKETPDPWLGTILSQIERNLLEKGTYRRQDVHGVVNRYFWDLVPVLKMVHDALRPGARFSLVVGDSLLAGAYVPGDLLVARLGARVGFEIEGITIARTRRSGQRRSFRLRESIVTLRRPGPSSAGG
jgi:hypothetical protein